MEDTSILKVESVEAEGEDEVNDVPTDRLPLASCLRSASYTALTDRPHLPIYSCAEEHFGQEREARIQEWNPSYYPFVETLKLRNHRRPVSLNPHFCEVPKSKSQAKRDLYVRLGIIELSLQNGLGSRYRLVPPPSKTFDFPMKCVAKILLGSKCFARRLREEACDEVVREWNKYKWDVKLSYAIHMEFFRKYQPNGLEQEIHDRAKYLYKVAVYERMYECKRVELAAACNLYNTNFFCIECFPEENDTFRVLPTPTEFDRSIYFFAKEAPYSRKIIDKKNYLYENFFLIWLNPVIRAGWNLIMKDSIMKLTYCNPDIGYFHLFEEDPYDPIEKFNETNNHKRVRYHYVDYCPNVYAMHYYQPRPWRLCERLMEALGCWLETEVDKRILTYNSLGVAQFNYLEKEFYRITEMSNPGFPIGEDQFERHTGAVEEFVCHLKCRTEEEYEPPKYRAGLMIKLYLAKQKRRMERRLELSEKALDANPHKHRHFSRPTATHKKHRIARHQIQKTVSRKPQQDRQ